MAKRVRRTKAQIEQSKGFGDTVEKVFQATGIDKVAKFILGEDCGCDKRKEVLNNLFPYAKPKCLEEKEYEYLTEFFSKPISTLTPTQQESLLVIYRRIFNSRAEATNCTSCWMQMIKELKLIHEQYKDENI